MEELSLVDPVQTPPSSSILVWVVYLVAIIAVIMIVALRLWRIPEGRGPPWWVRGEFLLCGWVLLVLVGLVASLLVGSFMGDGIDLKRQAITMSVAYAAQLIMIRILLYLFERLQMSLPLQERRPGGATVSRGPLGWAIGVGVLGFVVASATAQSLGMVAGLLQRMLTGVEPNAVGHQTLQAIRDSPGDGWVFVIMILVVIVTPVIEEFAYRGLVQQGFRRLGANRTVAIVITSCLFVFMHVPALPGPSIVSAVVTLLVLSLVFGWLFERTGRLVAPIVAHGLFNALNLVLFQFDF